MNMIITGDGHNNIEQMDSLANPIKEQYDVVANPPYGQETDYGNYYPIIGKNGDAIFLQHIIESMTSGGRAAVVIPEGLLFRSGTELKVRKYLLQRCDVKAIISLPAGVFRPYAKQNKTNIIFFEKCINQEKPSGTKQVWFYNLEQDGFDLNSDFRRPIKQNDIPDLLSKWSEQRNSEKSCLVTIDRIKENNYDLLFKTYNVKSDIENDGFVSFSKFLIPCNEKIMVEDNINYKQVRVQLHGRGAILRKTIKGKEILTKVQYVARKNNLIISKIDARNGALAIIPKELDGAVVTSDFPLFQIDSHIVDLEYLEACIKYGDFESILEKLSRGTTNRRRVKSDYLLKLSIYLPTDKQKLKIMSEFTTLTGKIEQYKKSLDKAYLEMNNLIGDNCKLAIDSSFQKK